MSRLQYNKKAQFSAVRPEVLERIKSGETVAAIYRDLLSRGAIDMSSALFYRQCTALRNEDSSIFRSGKSFNQVSHPKPSFSGVDRIQTIESWDRASDEELY